MTYAQLPYRQLQTMPGFFFKICPAKSLIGDHKPDQIDEKK
jgi:hypothetical protein